jgi:hypothetical protein
MRLLSLFVALAFALPLSAGWEYHRTIYRYPNGWTVIMDSTVWVPDQMPVAYVPSAPAPQPAATAPPVYYIDPSCQTGA